MTAPALSGERVSLGDILDLLDRWLEQERFTSLTFSYEEGGKHVTIMVEPMRPTPPITGEKP